MSVVVSVSVGLGLSVVGCCAEFSLWLDFVSGSKYLSGFGDHSSRACC